MGTAERASNCIFAGDPGGHSTYLRNCAGRVRKPHRSTRHISPESRVQLSHSVHVDGDPLVDRGTDQYRGDCAHLSQCRAAHPALAQRSSRSDFGYRRLVRGDRSIRLVSPTLRRLQHHLRIARRWHCAAGVDVHDLTHHSGGSGIQSYDLSAFAPGAGTGCDGEPDPDKRQ